MPEIIHDLVVIDFSCFLFIIKLNLSSAKIASSTSVVTSPSFASCLVTLNKSLDHLIKDLVRFREYCGHKNYHLEF